MFARIPSSPQLEVAYWRREAAKNEVFRRRLQWAPAVGLPLACGVARWSPLLGIFIALIALQIWLVGLYMTLVRRHEFADNLRCAEAKHVCERHGARHTPTAGSRGVREPLHGSPL